MFQELPPELFWEVIGYLWDDKPTLVACSLACRGLTEPSQRLFFASVVLRAPQRFFHHQRNPHVYQLGGISSNFLRLLDASPRISGYVECLQIVDIKDEGPEEVDDNNDENINSDDAIDTDDNNSHGDGDDDDEEFFGYNHWLCDDKSLPLILQRLQNLKALIVDFIYSWKELSKKIRTSLLRVLQLPSLLYLEFAPSPIELLSQPIHENVKHLNMRFSSSSKTVKNVLLPGPGTCGPIYLDSLYTSGIDAFMAFADSSSLPNCRFKIDRLRKLAIEFVDEPESFLRSWNLLQACRHTLQEFIFIPNLDVSSTSFPEAVIELNQLTSLRKLTIDVPITDLPRSNWWFIKFLRASSAPNQSLEDITIQAGYAASLVTSIGLHHWSDIADALACGKFPRLKRVHIAISSRTKLKFVKGIVKRLKASKYIASLQSRQDLDVIISYCYYNQDTFQFAPDRRWENVAMTDVPVDKKYR